jgi:hypothetical protein
MGVSTKNLMARMGHDNERAALDRPGDLGG